MPDLKQPARTALLVAARTLAAAVCLAFVVTARTTVGWGHLLVMLGGLAGLLLLLAAYNRRYR